MTELGGLAARYLDGRIRRGELAAGTAKNHRYALSKLVEVYGPHEARRLRRRHIEKWLETRRHLKPSSRRLQLSYVRTFCDWLVREDHVDVDPCEGIYRIRQPRRVPRALPAGDIARLLLHAPDARAKAIVALGVWCGLRISEVGRVKIEDWDRRDDILLVVGKGGHEREVPVPSEAVRYVDAYLAEHPATVGPLIRNQDRPWRPLTAGTLSAYVSRWMRDAGVKHAPFDGVASHALRHTAASDVLDACNDLRVVQQMLGHQHLPSTAIYLRRAGMPKIREAMQGRTYSALDATLPPAVEA